VNRLVTRRALLGGAAGSLLIVPRHVLGGRGYVPPSDKLTLGCVGVGAQGTRVMMDFLKEPDVQVIAVCDVNRQSSDYSEWGTNELRDKVRALLGNSTWGGSSSGCTAGRDPARSIVESYYAKRAAAGQYSGCRAYTDFRDMLAKESGLDAVAIGTPDHWHAPVAIAAMKQKKHVYCQKPMTHTLGEARRLAEVARETGVATQVALAVSASDSTRQLTEWIAAGAIGPVRRVENWSSRPFWPQGLERPQKSEPVPAGLDWDLWLGPAPERPFSHVYLPFVWRGWYDFGTGCLGDMGQYSLDTITRALKLGPPATAEASSTQVYKETFPAASIVRFEFPARAGMPPLTLTWYDGGLKPPRPPELEDGVEMGAENEGLLFIGDNGTILCDFEGDHPRLIPGSKMRAFQPPPDTLPRSKGHYREWIEAAKGAAVVEPLANFGFEAPITEALLLGNIALRTGEKLRWDAAGGRVANSAAAQALVAPPQRGKWE
jgi:predicted dehydrogenase